MGELDLHQLIRRYRTLRIAAPTAEAKLLASLAAQGQTTPVLVVRAGEAGAVAQYVLIDGYRRVAALERLGQDTVLAVAASMSEHEALLWHHQQARERSRTALAAALTRNDPLLLAKSDPPCEAAIDLQRATTNWMYFPSTSDLVLLLPERRR